MLVEDLIASLQKQNPKAVVVSQSPFNGDLIIERTSYPKATQLAEDGTLGNRKVFTPNWAGKTPIDVVFV